MNGAVSTCGHYFATTGFDCAVSVWHVTVGEDVTCVHRIEGFPDRLMAITFFPTETWDRSATAKAKATATGQGSSHHSPPTSVIVGDCRGFLFRVDWENSADGGAAHAEDADSTAPHTTTSAASNPTHKVLKLEMESAYSISSHCAQFFKHGAAVRKLCTMPHHKDLGAQEADKCGYLVSAGQDKKVKLQKFPTLTAKQMHGDPLPHEEEEPMNRDKITGFDVTFHLSDIRGLVLSTAKEGRVYTAGTTMCRWDDLRDANMRLEKVWVSPSMEFRKASLQEVWDIPSVFAIGMVQLSMIVYEHLVYYTMETHKDKMFVSSFFFPIDYPKKYAEQLHFAELGLAALTVLIFAIVMITDVHSMLQDKIIDVQRKYIKTPKAEFRVKEEQYTRYRQYIWFFLFTCASVAPVPCLQALSSTIRCLHVGDEFTLRVYPSINCERHNMEYQLLFRTSICLLIFYALLFAPLIIVNNDAQMLGHNYEKSKFRKAFFRWYPKSWYETLKRVEIIPYGTCSIISKQMVALKLAQVAAMLALPLVSDSVSVESPIFGNVALALSSAILLASLLQNPARYSRFRFLFIYFALVFWWTSVILFLKDEDVQFLPLFEPAFENIPNEDTAVKVALWGGQTIVLLISLIGFIFVGDTDLSVPEDANVKVPSLAANEKDPLLG